MLRFPKLISLLPILLIFAMSQSLVAEEKLRVWTNQAGKKMKGVLQEKEEGWVQILVKSKVYRIQIKTLSEADQKYIKEAQVFKTLRMRVTTVKAESSNAERGTDIRKIKVELENVQERKLSFKLVWIAQSHGRTKYGIHRVVDVDYDADGEYFHW